MRKQSILRASILLLPVLILGAGSGRAEPKAAPSKAPQTSQSQHESAVDPAAKDALTRMSDYFRSLPAFAVHEDVTREQVINSDLKVQKNSTADVTVRRPNGLKAEVCGDDDRSHSLFYDGKTISVYLPRHQYYAQSYAPPTIGGAIDMAESRYGVEFPASDFLRMISGEDFTKDLTAAGLVGTSRIGNVETDHYAYRSADVDYQIWIQKGDNPLPRKLVITSKKLPTQPEYSSIMTWDLAPKVCDATFAFTPPQSATKIAFGAPPPTGATLMQKTTQPKK